MQAAVQARILISPVVTQCLQLPSLAQQKLNQCPAYHKSRQYLIRKEAFHEKENIPDQRMLIKTHHISQLSYSVLKARGMLLYNQQWDMRSPHYHPNRLASSIPPATLPPQDCDLHCFNWDDTLVT